MLDVRRICSCRCSAVPVPPNSRSNTMRGFSSIGTGVVGDDQEIVFM